MKKYKKKIVAFLFLLILFEAATLLYGGSFFERKLSSEESSKMTFVELKEYFKDLANKKGAPYAYDVLKKTQVKPGTDLHLLGHVVGEVLYTQKGPEGMKYCTHDFRNACSHTIVVGLFSEKGEGAIPEIIEACEKAPGGRGAYNMCFHGLGHGVLSFTGYDMKKTIDLCLKTKTGKVGAREFPECVGGAIMETISGGDHDKKLWAKQRVLNLKYEDPLYPCNTDLIPREAKERCYTYITPYLFEVDQGSRDKPTAEDFERAFKYCETLFGVDREACFGGFGKEFVVLAKARDIREIENMSNDELLQVIKWCNLAAPEDGIRFCLRSVLANLYWGGENTYSVSLNYCRLLEEKDNGACFNKLIEMVHYYNNTKDYMELFCSDIPQKYLSKCVGRVKN